MLNTQKRAVALAVIIILVFCIFGTASAQVETPAKAALLMEFSTGTLVFEKNAEISYAPASITKLMTLLIGFEAIEKGLAKWDDKVYVSEEAWKVEGSRMFLEVNSKVPYRDIIVGISIVSANDACIALAEYLYGSIGGFVKVMNSRAAELGLTKTQFKNPHGLPEDGHHMSARDMAALARYLIQKFPEVLKIESTKEYTYNSIRQFNRNQLLGTFPGADGLKTGWTEEAGYCLVGTAIQNDIRFISVVLNTKDENERLSASKELLSYAFKNFFLLTVKNPGDKVADIAVKKGKELSVPVKVDSKITVVVPTAKRFDVEAVPVLATNELTAPVTEGTKVGTLEVRLDGKVLATSDISIAAGVEKAGFFTLLWRFIVNLFK